MKCPDCGLEQIQGSMHYPRYCITLLRERLASVEQELATVEQERNITRDVLRLFADLECRMQEQGRCAGDVKYGAPCRECLAIEVLKEGNQ